MCPNCVFDQNVSVSRQIVLPPSGSSVRRAMSEPPISVPPPFPPQPPQPPQPSVSPPPSPPQPPNDQDSGIEESVSDSADEDDTINYFLVSGPSNTRNFLQGHLLESTFSVFQLVGPDNVSALDLIDQLTAALRNMLQEGFQGVQPQDAVMVTIFCLQNMGNPITVPLTRFEHFRVEHIIAAMEAAKISGKLEFHLGDGIQFTLKVVKNPPSSSVNQIRGGARKSYIFSNVDRAIEDRRCIVKIVNPHDNMCMARSLAVGIANNDVKIAKKQNHDSGGSDSQTVKRETDALRDFKAIIRPNRPVQFLKALEYAEMIGITSETKCGIQEARKFEDALGIYIKIIGSDIFDQFVYNGWKSNFRAENPPTEENTVVLLRHFVPQETGEKEIHYSTIVDVATYLNRLNFCYHCDHSYNKPYSHKCEDVKQWCYSCFDRACRPPTGNSSQTVQEKCSTCGIKFRSDRCAILHKKIECHKNVYCIHCRRTFPRNKKKAQDGKLVFMTNTECLKKHVCMKICKVCKNETPANEVHDCYIQKTEFNTPSEKLIFIDFETDQTTKEHIPVFCHIKFFNQKKQTWEDRQFGLDPQHPDIKDAVGKFLFSKNFFGYTIIAHNMRAFDGCFLLQFMAENNLKPTPIFSGQKITTMLIPDLKIRILDSLNFLPMPLAQFPKAFGFENESVKGFFPHFFTRPENFNYIGEIPPPEAYGFKTMNKKVQTEFLEWHASRKNNPEDTFNFQEEMKMYCKQDVEILMKGCLAFRSKILEMTDNKCDPFTYVTLASVAAAIFRSMFLKEKQIAAVPPNGYSSYQRFSSKSLEWLEHLRQNCGKTKLSHIANSPYGECMRGKYRFDGVDTETNTVFEFNGCYYHGCPKCNEHKMDLQNPTTGLTFRALLERTLEKEHYVKNVLKWNLEVMWECEWEKMKKENQDIADFVSENQKIFTPMSPFDAFFGGRVESFKLCIDNKDRQQGSSDIKLCYVDFTSLYPFINSTKKYPVGHPEIILNGFGLMEDICDRFFGFIKCDILPPRELYIPVLPGKYGQDKKLIFTLCRTCATERSAVSNCRHTDQERSLNGTWFTEELKMALEMGYKIQQVHGVYHFQETTQELFTDYIKLFYKMKILASGRPANCATDDDLRNYIRQVQQKEGITLPFNDFVSNPPIRQISKLLINSLWGRFGLRRNMPTHKFVTSSNEIFDILEDGENEITNLLPLHKDMVLVAFKKTTPAFMDINNDANIYIAAMTTAYARIELYKKMNLLKERVVYCDTDSIVYIHEEGNDLETGSFLGELTNELQPEDFIVRFVSGGPKNYAYETEKGFKCVKVKGFTMTATNAQAFTFDNIKNILMASPLTQTSIQDEEEEEEFQDDLIFNQKKASSVLKILTKKERAINQAQWRNQAYQSFHGINPEEASAIAQQNFISTFNPAKIVRDKRWHLLSKPEQKLYSIMYDKRVVLNDFDSIPYGY